MPPQALRSRTPDPPSPLTLVRQGGASARAAGAESARDAKFREIYDGWFDHVVKWLFALGVPASDTEDLAQEIFLVVRRKLGRFDGGNLAGWLYRIAQLTVRDHRRRAWLRQLVGRRAAVLAHGLPPAPAGPGGSCQGTDSR